MQFTTLPGQRGSGALHLLDVGVGGGVLGRRGLLGGRGRLSGRGLCLRLGGRGGAPARTGSGFSGVGDRLVVAIDALVRSRGLAMGCHGDPQPSLGRVADGRDVGCGPDVRGIAVALANGDALPRGAAVGRGVEAGVDLQAAQRHGISRTHVVGDRTVVAGGGDHAVDHHLLDVAVGSGQLQRDAVGQRVVVLEAVVDHDTRPGGRDVLGDLDGRLVRLEGRLLVVGPRDAAADREQGEEADAGQGEGALHG